MKKIFFILFLVVAVVVYCERERSVTFGIDVSQYNGCINWDKVKSQRKTKDPITFVILRSTVGVDKDSRYQRNYKAAKAAGFVVGSYHYYRPDENSTKQFENFKKVLQLQKGDIIPAVDIEEQSSVQDMKSLKRGLRNFISLCEGEFGVKPILYTKLTMYEDYLKKEFSDCKLWVAAYSNFRRSNPIVRNSSIHQFTEEIRNIPGIPSKYVDGDDVRDLSDIIY